MRRTRRALPLAVALLSIVAGAALGASTASLVPSVARLASVAWPPSTGLLLAEVVTGGASASDEYVEITNASGSALDLSGYELVYVTSSGGTITRKAAWTAGRPIDPGRHLLVANISGVYAPVADATYSGGFAATGGALVLRPIGGAPADAIGWGDATNTFVEGAAASAPPAGSSIERRPGGLGGNVVDTNDGAADWFVQASPAAQNLAAPPVPAVLPTPTPAPSGTVDPSVEPPTPTPSPVPTPTPTPTPTTEPTPTPTPVPTPVPVLSIAAARALADGTEATVEGILTTDLPGLESGRAAFVQDASAGIGIYLTSTPPSLIAAGTPVRVRGTVGDRYAQRTLRADPAAVEVLGPSAPLPLARVRATGGAGEADEGSRVEVEGTVVETPTALADGLGLLLDDGSGPVRVVVGAGAADAIPVRGDLVLAVGPLGQRDASGSGEAGYRIYATIAGECRIITPSPTPTPTGPPPTPTPDPSATPTPTPSAEPSPSATTTPSPTPTPSPSAELTVISIADARGYAVGSVVRISGVVTAEAGRLGTPSLGAIQDGSAGIAIKLPDDVRAFERGSVLDVTGAIAQPYGQLELRVEPSGVGERHSGDLPEPFPIAGADLGEAVEGRLVAIVGVVEATPTKATSGDIAASLVAADGTRVKVMADGSSGLTASALVRGARYRVTGVAGQRASRRGSLDGYRIWLRDIEDVARLDGAASPSASPSPSPTSGPKTSGAPERAPSDGSSAIPIARAIGLRNAAVRVIGTITAPPELLDASGRRIVIQDASGAIEVLLPTDAPHVGTGDRLEVAGTMTTAYGAPRIRAATVVASGTSAVAPLVLRSAPGPGHEWRLVAVSGTVGPVHRLGERWVAELVVGADRVLIVGLPGSVIPSTALQEGRKATITGIVRRPYPTATDRRSTVNPRSPSDIALDPGGASIGGSRPGRGASGGGSGALAAEGSSPSGVSVVDVDLGRLADSIGALVRVGGVVISVDGDRILLDDGTARGRIRLAGEAAALLPLIEVDDALNATGRVAAGDSEPFVDVVDPAGLVRVGDLGESLSLAVPPVSPALPAGDGEMAASARVSGPASTGGPPPAAAVGVAVLVPVSVAAVALATTRRRRARAWLESRLAERLATVAGAGPQDGGGSAGG